MDHVTYFWWLLCMCVNTPMFYIPAGILSVYGVVAIGLAVTRATAESRLSGGLFVPLLIGMASLVVGTVYQDTQGEVAYWAQVANVALWLLQLPVIAYVTWRSGAFWVGALCFGLAQFWFGCLTCVVALMSIGGN
ncbi:MAG: hypothetical protein H8F28_09350 [Fibrella sp.]|nr:hypothetical protein [Armatimonadota bacterium]